MLSSSLLDSPLLVLLEATFDAVDRLLFAAVVAAVPLRGLVVVVAVLEALFAVPEPAVTAAAGVVPGRGVLGIKGGTEMVNDKQQWTKTNVSK